MEQKYKKQYVTPRLEVLVVKMEGIIAASGGPFRGFNSGNNGQKQYQW